MLSNTKCKKILNKNGIVYTDEEITQIKEVLYKFATLIHPLYEQNAKLKEENHSRTSTSEIKQTKIEYQK